MNDKTIESYKGILTNKCTCTTCKMLENDFIGLLESMMSSISNEVDEPVIVESK